MKRMLLTLLALLTLTGCAAAEEDAPLTLFAVNVGKADALLLQMGETTYLIDTGTAESWGALSRALKTLNITHLNGVLVTHTDKDHAGGAMALATSSITVDGWYAPRYYADVKESKHPAVRAAAVRGQSVTWLAGGDSLPLDGGKLTVLGPLQYFEKENCNSLVLLAEGGGGSMLLTGDMEFPEENTLLDANLIPRCTVLKVANHGEADACSDRLVQAVRPELAVISTNTAEEPDTPANRVLKALRSVGARIAQTQHASAGVRVVLSGGKGTMDLMQYADELPPAVSGVKILSKDVKDDTITLQNTADAAVDVSGWFLYSDKGGEIFVLPAGTVLEAGKTLRISSHSSDNPGDLVWPDTKVWHKNKDDEARLYDVYGRLMDTLP